MVLEFTKMNGAGNDFVLVDNREQKIKLTREQIVRLCDRHRGVGADGLFLLIPNRTGKADWTWEFFNSDGSTADMCGNGARCFGRFVQKLTGANGPTSFETGAGVITASFSGDRVTVNLTPPKDLHLNQQIAMASAPLPLPARNERGEGRGEGNSIQKSPSSPQPSPPSAGGEGETLVRTASPSVNPMAVGPGKAWVTVHSINTGVPHAVVQVADADQAMVQQLGREIRYHSHFAPKGTNVNFVQSLGENFVRVRTYERGVEGETLACGTGVSASALIASRLFNFRSPVKVQVQGGDILEVSFREVSGGFSDVKLTGPADFVFEGRIEI